jgi:signal transduction histidine kinase
VFICCCVTVHAQLNQENPIPGFDSTEHVHHLEKSTLVFIDSLRDVPLKDINRQPFVPLENVEFRKSIPRNLLLKTCYLRFSLEDSSNLPASYYYYPGMHYDNLDLFRVKPDGNLEAISGTHRKNGFLYFTTVPGGANHYIARLKFSRTNNNNISSKLVSPEQLQNFTLQLSNSIHDRNTAGFVLSGILLMMIIFTLVNYLVSGKKEFFYNCLYSLCMFLLIFLFSYLNNDTGKFNAFFLSYFSLFLLIIGTIFYIQFTRVFLNTASRYPGLDKIFKGEIWLFIICMVAYTIIHYFTDFVTLEVYLENAMKLISLLIGLIYIIIGMAIKDRLMNYLAIGNALQIQFSGISLIFILFGIEATNIFNSAIFYFEIGVVISVFFFLIGLTYKNRTELIERIREREAMKLDAEKKDFETKLAIMQAQQDERNRISADMHDDLGAGMTTIRLYSELAKNKMGDRKIPEIEKISASADELLIKMNAIIWSMTSSNDTLGNMVAYIRSYALEYFENTGIKCIIDIPERIPEVEVSGKIRRNIFLVVKEALNNIVKHSHATEVSLRLQQEPGGLSLVIHDNGKGIDFGNIRTFGNGLKNMKQRMEDIGIDFTIENSQGTTIRIFAPVSA